jgi:drug/metabolite transporter (DMT)-like permease
MAGVGSPLARARLYLVLAAVLWSLGSVFMRVLREPLGLGLDSPGISPVQIAFYRGLFGGLLMLALVRRSDVRFRPVMLGMVVAFTAMSALYLSALGLGAAANAIFLQNTAPVWVYLFAILLLGERADRRGAQVVVLAAIGAAVIVAGGWPRDLPPEQELSEVLVLFMGLGSGIVYAIVVLFLRVLREYATAWLVAINLLGTAATLGIFVFLTQGPSGFVAWVTAPSGRQLAVLAIFGAFQMALPYWLFTRGLRSVSAPEAAIITLIEPLLNPVWAYLITPEKDTPTAPMLLGGGLILLALIWRYLPLQRRVQSSVPASHDEPAEKKSETSG